MSVPHTLGPWRPADGCVYGDPDKDGWTAVALTPCPASPPHSARRRQWDVDARLIAAAPDLLAALQEIARIKAYSDDAAGYGDALTDARTIAERAIAKAEGNQ